MEKSHRQLTTKEWIIGITVILIAVGGIMNFLGIKTTQPSSAPKPGARGFEAYVYSQSLVQNRLQAPSTASFPGDVAPDVTETYKGIINAPSGSAEVYIVRAYVDAKNLFGVKLRSPYACQMLFFQDTNKWVGNCALEGDSNYSSFISGQKENW